MAERGRVGNADGEPSGIAFPEASDTLEPHELSAACEALLFASHEPVSAGELARALGVGERDVRRALEELEAHLAQGRRGIQLARVAGGYQLVTRARFFPYLRRWVGEGARRPALSAAALETLAIVAYRQPVSRAEIEAVRGVSCERALATLLERGLVEAAGRGPGPGRPVLYRTTRRFLAEFGLASLEELPSVPALQAGSGSMGRPLPGHTTSARPGGSSPPQPGPSDPGQGGPERGAASATT